MLAASFKEWLSSALVLYDLQARSVQQRELSLKYFAAIAHQTIGKFEMSVARLLKSELPAFMQAANEAPVCDTGAAIVGKYKSFAPSAGSDTLVCFDGRHGAARTQILT